jgi:homoserine dehydrogenase
MPVWRTIVKSRISKLAAAAVLLIGFGYVGGWFSSRWLLDTEELKSALESDIRQNLLVEINHDRKLALANYHNDLREQVDELRAEINQQHRRDLNEFAVKTLAASSAVTNQLLRDLIKNIAVLQTRDRQLVVSALNQMESNRIQDKTRFRNGLAAVAVQTADELRQTKLDVAKFIVQAQPDRLKPNVRETLDERSKQ